MFAETSQRHYAAVLQEIRDSGLWKEEREILGPQSAAIRTASGEMLNFCANNYLGLSSHPALLAAARAALDTHGYGMSSVRFICGTQDIHRALERTLATFLGMDETILYTSCFDANGGVFETLLGEEDAIISDALNHASIIDGIRLSKAQRYRYANADMNELEDCLRRAQAQRLRLVVTDGVFSMDGNMAPLPDIVALAERYDAMVMVDDSHATGFVGATGRGTPEHHGVQGRIDIITSTLGKALGGAAGGFTAARGDLVALLRQRSRPYLFSNSVPPPIVAAAHCALDLLAQSTELRDRLVAHTTYFRAEMMRRGFTLKTGVHPIVPIMLGDARLSQEFAKAMFAEGIYVVGFYFPIVPKGQARIRVQISAGHSRAQLDRALEAFEKVGRSLGVIT